MISSRYGMKVGLIGCVDSSEMALKTLLSIDGLDVAAVVTREQSAVNADFCDLSKICKVNQIPYHFENPKERYLSIEFLQKYDLDVVYCVGWSYLLNEDLLSLPRMGVIGFHPAKLPQNRGRHPIIWALALGLEETASTFFKMDTGADSGPILSQVNITIDSSDNAKSLYAKILNVAEVQIKKISLDLMRGSAVFKEQDHMKATYWRKRSRKDGNIDFRMTAEGIHDLVRALAPPYPCAEFLLVDEYILVPKSTLVLTEFPQNIEPGKVLDKSDDGILVKTHNKSAIWLQGFDTEKIEIGQFL